MRVQYRSGTWKIMYMTGFRMTNTKWQSSDTNITSYFVDALTEEIIA
ncbi:MAG: hypothetical protein ACLUD0_20410 [Eubacterium ramulus]